MAKRILFLANHFITLFAFRKELIQKLVENGDDVFLSLPESKENKYFEDLGCNIIITPIDRHGMNPVEDVKLIHFYRKMISHIKPDVIFSYTIKPNIYGCLAHGKKYRQICNITGTGGTFIKDNLLNKICTVLYRLSIKRAEKVFFQNQDDCDLFVNKKMVGENYEIIPGSGCNMNEHPYSEMPDDNTVKFLFIGRVMYLKGIDEYLEAARIIKNDYPNTVFYIAGWNEEKSYVSYVKEYEDKGAVKYIGFRSDISDWIRNCHCTISPSHGGEGIPNVLLETSASGRVCIGSNISGTKDVIEHNVTGYLFETGNVDDLISKIQTFLSLSYEEKSAMGKAGREKIEKEYNRDFVIDKYLELL